MKVVSDIVEDLFGRVRVIERLSKLCSAYQSFCKLSGELLHLSKRDDLWHLFAAHSKKLEQDAFLLVKGRLIDLAAGDGVGKLPKDPRVLHRTTTDQDAVR